jgi:hypothetical protein
MGANLIHKYTKNVWLQYSKHIYIANRHNKKEVSADINVLQFRILTNNLKIFKIQKDKICIILNIVTAW